MPPNHPSFPHTDVRAAVQWSNHHGTIKGRTIPLFCIPDPRPNDAHAQAPLARHGAALGAILDHAHATGKRVRVLGARWSLSAIVRPDEIAIDPANLNTMEKVPAHWIDPAYKPRAQAGYAPIFAQGGTHVSRINRELARAGLALQTSGASDGHRIAGCIATGTHGSALAVGGVHDTVLAVHLVLSSKRSLLIQPASSPAVTDDVAGWLAGKTGIPTASLRDDELFAAAQVSLGSLGVVHGVILEATPLYRLAGCTLARAWDDADVWRAVTTLDASSLPLPHKQRPYHFEVVMTPYPRKEHLGAFVRAYWKHPAPGGAVAPISPVPPERSSDLMEFIGALAAALDGPVAAAILAAAVNRELTRRYPTGDLRALPPGAVFGPSYLVPGTGTSTEIVVDHRHAHRALTAIYRVLSHGDSLGHHLLGALGLRFVPRTRATLGTNIHAMNLYIEMPSIRNVEVEQLYTRCWQALEQDNVPFACHWGQLHGMTPARMKRYYGPRIQRWESARRRILPTPAERRVFASPVAVEAGLT